MRDMVDVDLPLRRPTGRAHRALVGAQLSLACLVVAAAAAVGGAVQDRVDDHTGRLPDPDVVLPEATPPATGPIETRLARGPAPSTDGGHSVTVGGNGGPLATLGTLFVGWTLTAAAGTVGRRRLQEREHARWAADWAGVEPVWSGRVP